MATPKQQVWKKIYNFLEPLEVGSRVTWARLEEDLGVSKDSSRAAITRAKQELAKVHGKTLSLPESVGFTIVDVADAEKRFPWPEIG